MGSSTLAGSLLKQYESAKQLKSLREVHLQTISEYVSPGRGDFTTEHTRGERTDLNIFDSTAVIANDTLAAVLHSGLVPQDQQWMRLVHPDPSQRDNLLLNQWLEEATRRIFSVFNSPRNGFYQQTHEMFLDITAYGTGCMFIGTSEKAGIIFRTYHISQIYLLEDADGDIDVVFRKFKFSARQAAQEFGEEALPKSIKKALLDDPHKEFDFVHVVLPKEDAERLEEETEESY